MGYRHYLGTIPKKVAIELRNMPISDLLKKYSDNGEPDYVGIYTIIEQEGNVIYELGKYSKIACEISQDRPAFFLNEDTASYYTEYGVVILEQNDILRILDDYRQKNVEYFMEMSLKSPEEQKAYFETKTKTWGSKIQTPYNTNLKSTTIVNSWLYEYEVFDLARVYKSFDPEKNPCSLRMVIHDL